MTPQYFPVSSDGIIKLSSGSVCRLMFRLTPCEHHDTIMETYSLTLQYV